jgi:hypothetical protein
VGKGEEINSAEISNHQGVLMEEDQRCVMIIGGIQIFLPHIPVEARACVADAIEEGQPIVTVIEEEKSRY